MSEIMTTIFGKLGPYCGIAVLAYAVSCLKPNLLGSKTYADEKAWSDLCAALMRRAEQLMPIYNETGKEYINMVQSRLTFSGDLLEYMKQIDPSMKEIAEKQFVDNDCDKQDAIAVLRMQLNAILAKKEQKHG